MRANYPSMKIVIVTNHGGRQKVVYELKSGSLRIIKGRLQLLGMIGKGPAKISMSVSEEKE